MQDSSQNINTDRVNTTDAERSGAQAGQTVRESTNATQSSFNQTKDQAMAQLDSVPGQAAQMGRQAQAQANNFIQNAQAKLDAGVKAFLHGGKSDPTTTQDTTHR